MIKGGVAMQKSAVIGIGSISIAIAIVIVTEVVISVSIQRCSELINSRVDVSECSVCGEGS